MASGVIAIIVDAALRKAKSMALDNIKLMLGFPGQLDAMKTHVEGIEAVLDDADSKKTGTDVERVLVWLKGVERVSFEAEMVLDELFYESLRRRVLENNGGTPPQVCECSSFLFILESRIRDAYLSVRLGPSIRSINAEFKEFNDQIKTIGFVGREHPVATKPITDSSNERFFVGRDKEEDEIVDSLLLDSSNNNSRVSVLPITGMGGLGKTALAKSVYNNQQIMDRFSKRSWTCVSNKVDATDILKGILESLRGGNNMGISQQEPDAIVQGIKKELNGERFLFVLDDVWKFEWREGLLDILNGMAKSNSTGGGCCVLITTRSDKVAKGVRAFLGTFVLNKLSDDHCWSIIVKRVNEGGNSLGGLPFDVHKEQLLKKCQGLPFAAKAIGGLLCIHDQGSIVERILKIQEDVDKLIMRLLRLSYESLPSRCLKSCFVYCSVYPKDTVMDGDELIELWMAQSYLEDGAKGGETMEEVGANYLTILSQSSLLEKCWSWDGWKYQMHDFVHDLAESISQKKHDGDKYPAFRHVALGVEKLKDCWNEESTLARIEEGDICDAMLSKCIHARVMHLYLSRGVKILPNNVSMLIHVRSLSISGYGIKSLPESLCRLYNLQTLNLSDCDDLRCLPQGFSDLISLRHLHFSRGEEFKMPPNMGRLTCLQTLKFFNVWEENGHEMKELGNMENLKGSLSIRNLELVKGKEEATSAKLGAMKNLIELELNWGSTASDEDVFGFNSTTRRKGDIWKDEEVLEGLKPCVGVRELRIVNFMGFRLPGWLGNLPELEVLKLKDCENANELGYPGDGGFPKLKTLYIEGCSQLSSAPTSFPILVDLKVKDVEFSAVRDIIGTTTNSLKVLSLDGVSGMHSLSYVIESSLSSSLKKLSIVDCDDLSEIPSSTLECCSCLESLYVRTCGKLGSCPLNLQQTPSLSQIGFLDCPKLFTRDAMPRGFEHLTNLKGLLIDSKQSMDWDGLKRGCSTTLQFLEMKGSSHAQLPQQLQHFSSLVVLRISEFNSLERLPGWLGKLTSLQELRLHHCPKLEHLPMDAIGSLRKLRTLSIYRCRLLRETQGDENIKALPNLQVIWTD